MNKQTQGAVFGVLSFLALFRIGLLQSTEDGILLPFSPNMNNDEYNDEYNNEYIFGYKKDYDYYAKEDATLSADSNIYKDINIDEVIHKKDLNTEKSNMENSNTEDPMTDDPYTENNILNVNCNKFDSLFNFSDTIIKRLGKDFHNSPFTRCLNFEGNQIESVASGAFNSLPALEYLNLAGNSISFVFSFNGHNNLKVLILANQSLYYERILEISGEYPELRYLDLSNNKISSINRQNDYFQDVYSSTYEIRVFPRLSYLDLSYNKLTTFNNNFLFNRNITNLYLTNNNLYHVDLHIYSNLVELVLEGNDIRGIVDYSNSEYVWIDEMPELKYLWISNNRITKIDERILKKMNKLVTLDLSNNELESISIAQNYEFNSLENIYLDHNKLFSISMRHRLSNLSILSVTYNELKEIVPYFVDAPILKKLYLSNNGINAIHEHAFSKLELLEELYLQNNVLEQLPNKWSQNLRNLRYLNLSNNAFKTLESLSLIQSLPLIKIDFINNPIIYMKVEVLQNLPKNATIYLIPQFKDNELSKRSL
ncbi:PREDICTED: leucine-rich repeat-containing protein let-4-like [Polistes canadensis]|uniref:leucine-rich repeat-containing protein let-4-like n=1 Tax=Polistes canadensis TaxID=91411 RepID=UPI000719034C|nr:PREDICTED: leucine-rich repeat-containing protein let-4-like [Polistes canadensis]